MSGDTEKKLKQKFIPKLVSLLQTPEYKSLYTSIKLLKIGTLSGADYEKVVSTSYTSDTYTYYFIFGRAFTCPLCKEEHSRIFLDYVIETKDLSFRCSNDKSSPKVQM